MTLPWPLFTLPCAGAARAALPADAPPVATIIPGNVIGPEPPTLPADGAGPFILWSGWMGDTGSPPADGPFPADFRTWSGPGRSRLDAFCDAARPTLESRRLSILFRPHARHVLSDPQACVSFLAKRQGKLFGLVLDPAAFLSSGMLARADDHLTRAFEALAPHPAVAALVLTNLETIPGDPGPLGEAGLRACPLGRGLLPTSILAELVRQHWPPGRPILLPNPAADAACLAPTLR